MFSRFFEGFCIFRIFFTFSWRNFFFLQFYDKICYEEISVFTMIFERKFRFLRSFKEISFFFRDRLKEFYFFSNILTKLAVFQWTIDKINFSGNHLSKNLSVTIFIFKFSDWWPFFFLFSEPNALNFQKIQLHHWPDCTKWSFCIAKFWRNPILFNVSV